MNLGAGKLRRDSAVSKWYGILGLDYGKGHLDDLYRAAYHDGFADALALMKYEAELHGEGIEAAIMRATGLRP